MKRSFFQAAVVSIQLYGCTTWTLTKRLEKKRDGNYTRMLRAILNKSWQQHPTKHQLYGHLPPITKTIQGRRTRHAGHCWRIRDELISDVLLWTPAYGQAKAGRPAWTYILCEDTVCSPEDLSEAMNDREKWRERVRDIRGISWFRYETFITFLTFRFSDTRRETHNFYYADYAKPTTCGASRRPQLASPRLAPKINSPRLSSNLNCLFFFFQNTQESQPIASGHDVIHIPSHISYPGFLLWHLWLSHPPRTSVNTCTQCVHLTNPNDKI